MARSWPGHGQVSEGLWHGQWRVMARSWPMASSWLCYRSWLGHGLVMVNSRPGHNFVKTRSQAGHFQLMVKSRLGHNYVTFKLLIMKVSPKTFCNNISLVESYGYDRSFLWFRQVLHLQYEIFECYRPIGKVVESQNRFLVSRLLCTS